MSTVQTVCISIIVCVSCWAAGFLIGIWMMK